MLVWNECHEGHGCNRHAMFEDNTHVFSSFFPSWMCFFKGFGLSFEEPSIMGPKLEGYRLLTLTR